MQVLEPLVRHINGCIQTGDITDEQAYTVIQLLGYPEFDASVEAIAKVAWQGLYDDIDEKNHDIRIANLAQLDRYYAISIVKYLPAFLMNESKWRDFEIQQYGAASLYLVGWHLGNIPNHEAIMEALHLSQFRKFAVSLDKAYTVAIDICDSGKRFWPFETPVGPWLLLNTSLLWNEDEQRQQKMSKKIPSPRTTYEQNKKVWNKNFDLEGPKTVIELKGLNFIKHFANGFLTAANTFANLDNNFRKTSWKPYVQSIKAWNRFYRDAPKEDHIAPGRPLKGHTRIIPRTNSCKGM